MLLPRVLTAFLLQGLLVSTLFVFGHLRWFEPLLWCVFLLLMWEWGNVVGLKHKLLQATNTLVLAALGVMLYFSMQGDNTLWWLLLTATLTWFLYVPWLLNYPRIGAWQFMGVRLALGALIIVSALYGFFIIVRVGFPHGSWMIFAVTMVVAALDVGSYFSGKWWGKTPMASKISPNKTIGGLIGGVVTALCMALLFAWGWWHYTGQAKEALYFMLAMTVTLPFGIGGDLLISLFKRYMKIKDTSNILPGHGGMLDRLDGVVAALPPYVLVLLMTGLA